MPLATAAANGATVAVVRGTHHLNAGDPAFLAHLRLQHGIVVLLEESDEFIGVSPFCFVVVLDNIRFVGTILTCLRGRF